MATFPTPFRRPKDEHVPDTKTPTSSDPFMEKAPKDIDVNRNKLDRPSTGSMPLDRIVSGCPYTPPEASGSLPAETNEQQPKGKSN